MSERDERRSGSDREEVSPDPAGSAEEGRTAAGEIWIDVSQERVWRALTEARELERWFPLDASVEPGAGGTIRMAWGPEYDAGMEILAWDPPRHLRTTWLGEGVVTDYHLEAEDGGTRIRVVSSGFPADPTWDEWVEGTARGWAWELRSLKHYLEEREGRSRSALFIRRRVRLPRTEVWDRLTGTGGMPARWSRGERVDESPPVQWGTILDDPSGALCRISVEPVWHDDRSGDPDDRARAHDATLWLSIWHRPGSDTAAGADAVDAIEAELVGALERIFPEGRTTVEVRKATGADG